MKKIGIITYFYYYNYGTVLQAYALQLVIDTLGKGNCKAEIIDCRFGEKDLTWLDILKIRSKLLFYYIFEIRKVIGNINGKRIYAKYDSKISLRKKFFEKFIKDYCHLTPKTYGRSDDLYFEPPIFDIYITGSDQTWSPKVGLRDSLFLGFAPDDKIRAAYAPSIGVAEYSEENKQYVKEHLKKYQFVSCREKYGTDNLKSLSPVPVEMVLDPTLLVRSDEWRKIVVKPSIGGKYILCYFIGDRKYYRDFAERLSKQLNLPLIFIPVSFLDFSPSENLKWETGPREFLGLIDNAEVVLTDSFHGTIFSINFNKTFYSFIKHSGKKAMDNMRIVDILGRMNLIDRFKDSYNGGPIDYTPINYTVTNELLEEERSKSELFIKKILRATV